MISVILSLGCQPDEPQASLATTNRCNHVHVVLDVVLLFMYAVLYCLYSVTVENKITTTRLFNSRVDVDDDAAMMVIEMQEPGH